MTPFEKAIILLVAIVATFAVRWCILNDPDRLDDLADAALEDERFPLPEHGGVRVADTVVEACEHALVTGNDIPLLINGVRLVATPQSDPRDLLAEYWDEVTRD